MSWLVDILIELIIEYSRAKLPSVVFREKKWKKKNLARVICALIPMPKAPRVYLNLATWRHMQHGLDEKDESQDQKTIKILQSELTELKRQVAFILEKQALPMIESPKPKKCSAMPPPPPPPPPPPMPPPLAVQERVASTEIAREDIINRRGNLRPTVKNEIKPHRDPTNMLEEVLKKRFSVSQFSDSETSDSSSFEISFD